MGKLYHLIGAGRGACDLLAPREPVRREVEPRVAPVIVLPRKTSEKAPAVSKEEAREDFLAYGNSWFR